MDGLEGERSRTDESLSDMLGGRLFAGFVTLPTVSTRLSFNTYVADFVPFHSTVAALRAWIA
jgi:hypothetical protein